MECPTSIQIVRWDPAHNNLFLDEDILREKLCNDDIKDSYLCVISICGVYRQGKSFILNFFLRYLRLKYSKNRDVADGEWLQIGNERLEGFKFAHGTRRDTTGIHMWSEIFQTTVSDEKVAIILLDTQGSFDNRSSVDDCAKIFALSTLLSSVQIYNLQRLLKAYDLDHLKVFGGYGKFMSDSGSNSAPFQKLCILIRDWMCLCDHPYGYEEGLNMLEDFISGDGGVQNRNDTLDHLFQEIACFLMPYPGPLVDNNAHFSGDLNEIDTSFKEQVQVFVSSLLAPENLLIKSVNGRKITAEELMGFIEEYNKVLRSGDLFKIESVFEATAKAYYGSVHLKAYRMYDESMSAKNVGVHKDKDLDCDHELFKNASLDYFKRKKFDDDIFLRYLSELEQEIEERLDFYKQANNERKEAYYSSEVLKAYDIYKTAMNTYDSDDKIHKDEDLAGDHELFKNRSFDYFRRKQIQNDSMFNYHFLKLDQKIAKRFEFYKQANEERRTRKRKKILKIFGVTVNVLGIGIALGTIGFVNSLPLAGSLLFFLKK